MLTGVIGGILSFKPYRYNGFNLLRSTRYSVWNANDKNKYVIIQRNYIYVYIYMNFFSVMPMVRYIYIYIYIYIRLQRSPWVDHRLEAFTLSSLRLWSQMPWRNALLKHESKSLLTVWRHRYLWHCCRCTAKGHIGTIPVNNFPRFRTSGVVRFNERKWSYTVKGQKQTIPRTHYFGYADYADDIALLANTTTQTESQQHSLEQEAGSICLNVNANKTEYMCLNQSGDISTLNGGSLKLVDIFAYCGISVSPTENDISTWLSKAWTTIDRLSVI